MRYNDLIYDPLLEAQLTPGQVKAIELKIKDYEEDLRKLRRQKSELDDKFIYGNFPKQLKDKVNAYIDAYSKAIKDLEDKIKQQGKSKQFDNFIAGIEKNCSEILEVYRQRGKTFYSGFRYTSGNPAVYGKPPAKLELGSYYFSRYGSEIQTIIENLFDEVSFESAILANADAYESTTDGRSPFMVFPRNGFKFFWSEDQSQLNISETYITKLFDYDYIEEAWETFINDPDMLKAFIDAGGDYDPNYSKREYIGQSDGFMGRWNYKGNIRAISELTTKGIADDKWTYMDRWTAWVSKESFQRFFNLKTTDIVRPLGYNHDCVINTTGVYGIQQKFRKQVFDALRITY